MPCGTNRRTLWLVVNKTVSRKVTCWRKLLCNNYQFRLSYGWCSFQAADNDCIMTPLRPKEIRVGVAWLTEVYDPGPLPTGSGIEEEELTFHCSVEADYVEVCTECEAAAHGRLASQARTETSGLIQECVPTRDSVPHTIKEKGQQIFYLLALWGMIGRL